MLVQHLVERRQDASTDKNEFEPFECPACRRIHFVSKAGKLMGEDS
jgi:hypothetical protein